MAGSVEEFLDGIYDKDSEKEAPKKASENDSTLERQKEDIESNIDTTTINAIISQFNTSIDTKIQALGKRLSVLQFQNIEGENRIQIQELFGFIKELSDDSFSGTDIVSLRIYVSRIEKIYNSIQVEKDAVTEEAKVSTEDEKASWLNQKMSERIGEGWEDLKKTWHIETSEDYSKLEKFLDLAGDALGFVILDVGASLLETLLREGGSLTIGSLYDAFVFLLKKEANIIYGLYEDGDYGILFLFLYVQANAGFVGYRYARDYLTTNYGDKAAKIGDDTGRIKKWIKSTLGSNYLDAVDGKTNIFELGETQGVSEKQNEYLKRKKTIDILKSVYYDDPKGYNKLQNIETRFMQANSKTFWRELYMLLEKRGLVRKIISGSIKPEFLKSELEAQVIAARNKLQKKHFETVGILYSTSEAGDNLTIDKNKESNFLKGLRADIENNPQLTAKERQARIANLDRYLNQITTNKVLKKESVLEELIRIRDGYATKLEMFAKIEEELSKTPEGGFIKSNAQNILDIILLRKRNLEGFKTKISEGKWNGTFEEFEDIIKKIQVSKVFISFGNTKKIDFGNLDTFIKETEVRALDFSEKTKIYGKDPIGNLKNWISYIVPDNSTEKNMKDILKKFEENKTPYSETQFYRELDRVKRGFLPSNEVLSKLERIKDRIIIPEVAKKENGILTKIRNLQFSIEKTSTETMRYTHLGGVKDFVNDALVHLTIGNYSSALESLNNAVGISTGNIKNMLLNIVSDVKSFLSFKISRKTITPDRLRELSDVDKKKLETIEKYSNDARKGDIDLNSKDIESIEKGTSEYDSSKKAPSFSDEDGKSLKKELEAYKNLDQEDYLKSIGLTEENPGVQRLEKSVLDSLKSERNLFKIQKEIDRAPGVGSSFNIDAELKSFADSIYHHSYTRGQASEIIAQIFSGKKFSDIDVKSIIQTTTKHSQSLSILGGLKDDVEKKITTLSKEEKARIFDFINNNGMGSEEHLPSNLKRDIKAFETLGDTEKLIQTQQAELERITQDLNIVSNDEDLKKVREEFNDYIKDQKIDRTSEEFKSYIEAFENKLTHKTSELNTGKGLIIGGGPKKGKTEPIQKNPVVEASNLSMEQMEQMRIKAEDFADRIILETTLNGGKAPGDIRAIRKIIRDEIGKNISATTSPDDMENIILDIFRTHLKGDTSIPLDTKAVRSFEQISEDFKLRAIANGISEDMIGKTAKGSAKGLLNFFEREIKPEKLLKFLL